MLATSSGVSSESSAFAPEAETKMGSKSSGDEHPIEPGAPCDDNIVCNVSNREIPKLASASNPFETENNRVSADFLLDSNEREADADAVIVATRYPLPANSRETKAIEVRHSQAAANIWVILILYKSFRLAKLELELDDFLNVYFWIENGAKRRAMIHQK